MCIKGVACGSGFPDFPRNINNPILQLYDQKGVYRVIKVSSCHFIYLLKSKITGLNGAHIKTVKLIPMACMLGLLGYENPGLARILRCKE